MITHRVNSPTINNPLSPVINDTLSRGPENWNHYNIKSVNISPFTPESRKNSLPTKALSDDSNIIDKNISNAKKAAALSKQATQESSTDKRVKRQTDLDNICASSSCKESVLDQKNTIDQFLSDFENRILDKYSHNDIINFIDGFTTYFDNCVTHWLKRNSDIPKDGWISDKEWQDGLDFDDEKIKQAIMANNPHEEGMATSHYLFWLTVKPMDTSPSSPNSIVHYLYNHVQDFFATSPLFNRTKLREVTNPPPSTDSATSLPTPYPVTDANQRRITKPNITTIATTDLRSASGTAVSDRIPETVTSKMAILTSGLSGVTSFSNTTDKILDNCIASTRVNQIEEHIKNYQIMNPEIDISAFSNVIQNTLELYRLTCFIETSIIFANAIANTHPEKSRTVKSIIQNLINELNSPTHEMDVTETSGRRKKRSPVVMTDLYKNYIRQLKEIIGKQKIDSFFSGFDFIRDAFIKEASSDFSSDKTYHFKQLMQDSKEIDIAASKVKELTATVSQYISNKDFYQAGVESFKMNLVSSRITGYYPSSSLVNSEVVYSELYRKISEQIKASTASLSELTTFNLYELTATSQLYNPFFIPEAVFSEAGYCNANTLIGSLADAIEATQVSSRNLVKSILGSADKYSLMPLNVRFIIQTLSDICCSDITKFDKALANKYYSGKFDLSSFAQKSTAAIEDILAASVDDAIPVSDVQQVISEMIKALRKKLAAHPQSERISVQASLITDSHKSRISAAKESDNKFRLTYEDVRSGLYIMRANSLQELSAKTQLPAFEPLRALLEEELDTDHLLHPEDNMPHLAFTPDDQLETLGALALFEDSCLTIKDIVSQPVEQLANLDKIRTTDFILQYLETIQQPESASLLRQPVTEGFQPIPELVSTSEPVILQMREVLAELEYVHNTGEDKVSESARLLNNNICRAIANVHGILELLEARASQSANPEQAMASLASLQQAALPESSPNTIASIGELLQLLTARDLLEILDEYNALLISGFSLPQPLPAPPAASDAASGLSGANAAAMAGGSAAGGAAGAIPAFLLALRQAGSLGGGTANTGLSMPGSEPDPDEVQRLLDEMKQEVDEEQQIDDLPDPPDNDPDLDAPKPQKEEPLQRCKRSGGCPDGPDGPDEPVNPDNPDVFNPAILGTGGVEAAVGEDELGGLLALLGSGATGLFGILSGLFGHKNKSQSRDKLDKAVGQLQIKNTQKTQSNDKNNNPALLATPATTPPPNKGQHKDRVTPASWPTTTPGREQTVPRSSGSSASALASTAITAEKRAATIADNTTSETTITVANPSSSDSSASIGSGKTSTVTLPTGSSAVTSKTPESPGYSSTAPMSSERTEVSSRSTTSSLLSSAPTEDRTAATIADGTTSAPITTANPSPSDSSASTGSSKTSTVSPSAGSSSVASKTSESPGYSSTAPMSSERTEVSSRSTTSSLLSSAPTEDRMATTIADDTTSATITTANPSSSDSSASTGSSKTSTVSPSAGNTSVASKTSESRGNSSTALLSSTILSKSLEESSKSTINSLLSTATTGGKATATISDGSSIMNDTLTPPAGPSAENTVTIPVGSYTTSLTINTARPRSVLATPENQTGHSSITTSTLSSSEHPSKILSSPDSGETFETATGTMHNPHPISEIKTTKEKSAMELTTVATSSKTDFPASKKTDEQYNQSMPFLEDLNKLIRKINTQLLNDEKIFFTEFSEKSPSIKSKDRIFRLSTNLKNKISTKYLKGDYKILKHAQAIKEKLDSQIEAVRREDKDNTEETETIINALIAELEMIDTEVNTYKEQSKEQLDKVINTLEVKTKQAIEEFRLTNKPSLAYDSAIFTALPRRHHKNNTPSKLLSAEKQIINKRSIDNSLLAAAQQNIELSPATSGAKRPGHFVSDMVIGAASILSRISPGLVVNNAYNRIAGTGTEQTGRSLPHKEPPATTDTVRPINNSEDKSNRQAPDVPQIIPTITNINRRVSQPDNIPGITSGETAQNISINNMDASLLQLASLVAAWTTGQKIATNHSLLADRPDPISAIHNSPASNLLANSATLAMTILDSKNFKDLISPDQKQSLDASWTPKNILDIATLQEYCAHQGHPEALSQGFLDAVYNSPEVGINSGSDNFEVNRDGQLTIRKGKPEREYLSLLLHSLARDYRKLSAPIAITENTDEVTDQTLAEQIHTQLPDATSADRAIIYRGIKLKDQQKTTWKASITGLSWPADRNDQIRTMHDLLNPVTGSQRRESAPKDKSESKQSVSMSRQVIQELNGRNLKQAQEKFFKLSPAEMQGSIERLKNKEDICQLDQSEEAYHKVEKGLSELLTGKSRKEPILDKAREFQETNNLRTPLHKANAAMTLMQDINEAQLKQQAWELLVYQHDIKIAVKRELKRQVELQQRIIKEKRSDTPVEAQALSQIIPELLGSERFTCYERSQRHNGKNKLPIPYKLLKYQGPEMDARLKQYGEIKKLTGSLYPGIFGQDTTSQLEIIGSVSQQCLVALHLNGKELSQQKQTDFIRYLLQKERAIEADKNQSI